MKESNRESFSELPKWLREDILREEAGDDPWLQDRYNRNIREIENKVFIRGYSLFPTRGVLCFPPVRKSRKSVGDYSIHEEE